MKKAIILFICLTLLAGCTAAEKTASESPSNTPLVIEPVEVTAAPTPPVIDEIDSEAFRRQRFEAIIGIIPAKYRIAIPKEEIIGAEAELDIKSCSVTIEWATNHSMKDVAALISEKLPYNMVKSDTDWRNPDDSGFDIGTRIKQSEQGLKITYIFSVEKAEGTILTDGFPIDIYSELPQELDLTSARRMVSYDDIRSVWRYVLVWNIGEQGQSITDKLSDLYMSRDGYVERNNDGNRTIQYDIGRNEKMVIGWRTQDEYTLDAAYEYTVPGHLESELMQLLLEGGPSILVSDLPEECLEILHTAKGASLTYYAIDGIICYSMTGPNNESHPYAEKAALLTGAPLTQNERGGYNFAGDGYSLTIKFNEQMAGWEYEKEATEGFMHPFIHDIYPLEYEPELPDVIKEKLFSMSTGYWAGDKIEAEMERTYFIEDIKAAEKALDALKNTLSDYPGFYYNNKDGITSLECNIKEYRLSCVLEDNGGMLLLKVKFRYRQ